MANPYPPILLTDDDIAGLVDQQQVNLLVEAVFAAEALGAARALPVIVEQLDPFSAHFGVKSGYLMPGNETSPEFPGRILREEVGAVLGLKTGGYWDRNQSDWGICGHQATMVLLDPKTGRLQAVLGANVITRLRTAAAGAVAAKYLSRPDSRTVAVIGAGEQAHAQLAALCLVRDVQEIRIWTRRPEAATDFAHEWNKRGINTTATKSIRAAALGADIVITATAAREPLVHLRDLTPGVHINAVGSDGIGKQELSVDVLQSATVFVDKRQQSLEIGELQHAVRAGLPAAKMIHAEMGEVLVGRKKARTRPDEITVFDSSGVTIQDLVVAGYVLGKWKALQAGFRSAAVVPA
jgi:alanine dehydrogenase